MTKLQLIACGFVSTLFLHSCSEVLEPVSFFGGKHSVEAQSVQEDFEIKIKSLTFESARDANKAPYPRRLMQNGVTSHSPLPRIQSSNRSDREVSIIPLPGYNPPST